MRYKTVWLRPLLSALAALLLLMLLFQHFGGLTDFFNNFFELTLIVCKKYASLFYNQYYRTF